MIANLPCLCLQRWGLLSYLPYYGYIYLLTYRKIDIVGRRQNWALWKAAHDEIDPLPWEWRGNARNIIIDSANCGRPRTSTLNAMAKYAEEVPLMTSEKSDTVTWAGASIWPLMFSA